MINMFFGKQTCLKQYIQDRVIKDYDLPEVTDITNTDYIVIFDENDSRKISLSNIINNTVDKNKPAVVTVVKADGSKLTMLEAIEAIPDNRKKLGLIVTYNDVDAGWSLIQYTADNLDMWESTMNWKTITTDVAVSTINARINEVETACKESDSVLTVNYNTLNSKVQSLVTDYTQYVNSTKNELESVIQGLTVHGVRIVDLENLTNRISTTLDLDNQGENLTYAVRLQSAEETIEYFGPIINKLNVNVNNMSTTLQDYEGRISTLETDLGKTNIKLSDITNILPSYNSRIKALEDWKNSQG